MSRDDTHVCGAWCDLQATYNHQVEMLLCAAPYVNIGVSNEGDDCLASRSNYDLEQLEDLRCTLNTYMALPEVVAALEWIREGK